MGKASPDLAWLHIVVNNLLPFVPLTNAEAMSTRRGLVWLLLLVTMFTAGQIDAKKSSSSSGKGDDVKAGAKDPVIEEVTSKQLERLLNDKDFVAVFWCEWRRNMKFILN